MIAAIRAEWTPVSYNLYASIGDYIQGPTIA